MGKALRNNNTDTDTENNEEVSQYERKLVQVSISATYGLYSRNALKHVNFFVLFKRLYSSTISLLPQNLNSVDILGNIFFI